LNVDHSDLHSFPTRRSSDLYSMYSINLNWGSDTESFFNNSYLQLGADPGQVGSFVPSVLIPLIIVWIVVLGILFKGVKKGIEIRSEEHTSELQSRFDLVCRL